MRYSDDETDLIVLSEARLPYGVIKKLYGNFTATKPNFEENYDYLIKKLSSRVYNVIESNFKDGEKRKKIADKLERENIICIPFFSEKYPPLLKEEETFPPLLYCSGDLSLLEREKFAIVGSRVTTPLMLAECEGVSKKLAENFVIVSGGASGADAAAFEGAKASGNVITVIACGISPAVKKKYLTPQGGLIVTEYPAGTSAMPYFFPQRNRIIAGLSRGVLVVSAAEKSGALITAQYAKNLRRDIFAFPYGLEVKSGAGCNALIKRGAYLAESAADISGFYGFDEKKEKINLPKEEELVYSAIAERGEALISEISDDLNIPVCEILPIISSLEIKGLAVRLGGNRYGIKRL